MKKRYVISIILIWLLCACVPFKTNTPTATLTPYPTNTHIPPTATSTPIPVLTLDSFSPIIKPVGTHGNMICYTYSGDINDLDKITLLATITQDNNVIEESIPQEKIDDLNCFELIDALYRPDIEVIVTMVASSSNFHLLNNVQDTNLGKYTLTPFLTWIFGDSNLGNVMNFPNSSHEFAYDIAGVSSQYPNAFGHPVYSPCDGVVVVSGFVDTGASQFHNFWLNCVDTGFFVQMGHMLPIMKVGDLVHTSQEVGSINEDPTVDWFGHIHFRIDAMEKMEKFVDPFNPNQQLGGDKLETGFWLDNTLPEQVRLLIKKGVFSPNYTSSDYMPRIDSIYPGLFQIIVPDG